MSNNNISAPKPDEQAMTGEEYNALRQDLRILARTGNVVIGAKGAR